MLLLITVTLNFKVEAKSCETPWHEVAEGAEHSSRLPGGPEGPHTGCAATTGLDTMAVYAAIFLLLYLQPHDAQS